MGIDHNISVLYAADGVYKTFLSRKRIYNTKDKYFVQATNGEWQELSAIHFQGGYKRAIKYFYNQNNFLLLFTSLKINIGRRIRFTLKKHNIPL